VEARAAAGWVVQTSVRMPAGARRFGGCSVQGVGQHCAGRHWGCVRRGCLGERPRPGPVRGRSRRDAGDDHSTSSEHEDPEEGTGNRRQPSRPATLPKGAFITGSKSLHFTPAGPRATALGRKRSPMPVISTRARDGLTLDFAFFRLCRKTWLDARISAAFARAVRR
jgi:hypothetical protein